MLLSGQSSRESGVNNSRMPSHPPRYAPETPFPPYTYVPGRAPHPVTDPRGHMFGAPPEPIEPSAAEDWSGCRTYRYAIDLFNHGFYWEAHEVWERLWIAAGRRGVAADFLKGLIKLAAAGVKVREGNRAGAGRHLARAVQLFQQTIQSQQDPGQRDFGLDLRKLLEGARKPPPDADAVQDGAVSPVFDFVLVLES